jgi:hypothetical protein
MALLVHEGNRRQDSSIVNPIAKTGSLRVDFLPDDTVFTSKFSF